MYMEYMLYSQCQQIDEMAMLVEKLAHQEQKIQTNKHARKQTNHLPKTCRHTNSGNYVYENIFIDL